MKRKNLIMPLFIALVLLASCTQAPVKGVQSSIFETGDIKNVKITANNCQVREGCSPDSGVLQTSGKNTTLDVLGKVADWYAVKLPDNNIGFVPENQCKPVVTGKDTKPNITTPGTTPGMSPNNTPGTIPNTTKQPKTNDTNTSPNYTPGTNDTTPGTTAKDTDTTNSNSLSDQEQEMLRLVNEARAQNNVPALKLDMELTNVARIKSQDMIDNNYFSHNSPTYGSPFDMMNDFGIEYVKAGENIAGNQSVQNAHDSLMKSPGHRKNILDASYTHIGLGIKEGGQYGNMFTQMFISKPQ